MESKFYGIPVLGVPFFADQPGRVKNAVEEGWAVQLDFSTLTEQSVLESLNKILKNSNYTVTVKRLSNIYRDRPMDPMKTAIYWIEYVIRHKGAAHMRSPAAQLNFLQCNYLDVFAFLSMSLYLISRLTKKLSRGCKFFISSHLKSNGGEKVMDIKKFI